MDSTTLPRLSGSPSHLGLGTRIYLSPSTAYMLGTGQLHPPAGLSFGVPPSLPGVGTGILTCCPSPTAFALGLGPTNPTWIVLPLEPLGIR